MAVALDVSESTLRNWLAGRSEPGVSQLATIAEILGVPVTWLLEDKAPLDEDATPLPIPGSQPRLAQDGGWRKVDDLADWIALASELSANGVSPAEALEIVRSVKSRSC